MRKITFCIFISLGLSAMGRPHSDPQLLSTEDFFGEEIIREIENLGIPFATRGSLMSIMFDAPPTSQPARILETLNYDLCTLPLELTLQFFWREYSESEPPTRRHRGAFIEVEDLHSPEGECLSEGAESLLQEYSAEEIANFLSEAQVPIESIELEVEGFPGHNSWRSTYYLVLDRNSAGEITTASIREEWRVITPWGYVIQQIQQNPEPSLGENWLGRFSFPLQLGYWYVN